MAARPTDRAATPVQLVAAQPAATAPDASILAALLQYEGDLRRQQSVDELLYFIANESRRVLGYEQMFILRGSRLSAHMQVACASSLATIDRNAPLIQAIEKVISGIDTADQQAIDTAVQGDDAALGEYPFRSWRWQPLKRSDAEPFGGLLIARAAPMSDAEVFRMERIAETASHAWRALTGDEPVRRVGRFGPKERKGALIGLSLVALCPVQMSALAPVEIVAARPFVVAAPFSGVIARIHVPPNAPVKKGQVLVSFDDVKLSNELQLAEEKRAVAKARAERATSAAFGAAEEGREIAIARAEYDLAEAEYKFAREVMDKSTIKAPRDGMAIYGDRRDLEGRAINVGDPILQVADPRSISMRIDLPAAEQLAIPKDGRVQVWLDAQPLWSIEGAVQYASYQARQTPEGVLAFAVNAKPVSATPRIGSRGTAKLYGSWVPLGYSIFRRPIATLRQTIGI
jgi:Biotin-lipoyl like/HlyD family secretion protein